MEVTKETERALKLIASSELASEFFDQLIEVGNGDDRTSDTFDELLKKLWGAAAVGWFLNGRDLSEMPDPQVFSDATIILRKFFESVKFDLDCHFTNEN